MTAKLAIVGDGDAILIFKAAGVAAFAANDEKTARDVLRKVAREYQIIFITEKLAESLGDFLKRFDEEPYPVVLPIPSADGDGSYGKETLKRAMERALGVDILFHND